MTSDIYQKYFQNKKITAMGLGLLGRGVGDAEFLASCGADLIITDLKSESELKTSLEKLKEFNNIKYTLGEHKMEDFEHRDYVLKSSGVLLDSKYILHARHSGSEVIMSAAMITKIIYENLPNVKVIGVTGTRGKTTTTKLIYHVINNYLMGDERRVHLGGNIRGVANLPLLRDIEDGDYLVLELDSWQLQGYGDLKLSPHISVFTNFMPDHMNYYKDNMELYFDDKANIYKYQHAGDKTQVLVTNLELGEKIHSIDPDLDIIVPEYFKTAPQDRVRYESWLIGKHNEELISLAVEVCKAVGIDEGKILEYVRTFEAEEGRLELMKISPSSENMNTLVYNDNNATTPEASTVAIESIMNHYKLAPILITGGKSKGLDLNNYASVIKENVKELILLKGTGTQELIQKLEELNSNVKYRIFNSLEECVSEAFGTSDNAKKMILFSPAFASFSHEFNNEYERNDEFVRCVAKYSNI